MDPPPRDEGFCLHTGVVGRVFEAHGIESNCELIKTVYGTDLKPIEGLLEDP